MSSASLPEEERKKEERKRRRARAKASTKKGYHSSQTNCHYNNLILVSLLEGEDTSQAFTGVCIAQAFPFLAEIDISLFR